MFLFAVRNILSERAEKKLPRFLENVQRFSENLRRFLEKLRRFSENLRRFLEKLRRFLEKLRRFLRKLRGNRKIDGEQLPIVEYFRDRKAR